MASRKARSVVWIADFEFAKVLAEKGDKTVAQRAGVELLELAVFKSEVLEETVALTLKLRRMQRHRCAEREARQRDVQATGVDFGGARVAGEGMESELSLGGERRAGQIHGEHAVTRVVVTRQRERGAAEDDGGNAGALAAFVRERVARADREARLPQPREVRVRAVDASEETVCISGRDFARRAVPAVDDEEFVGVELLGQAAARDAECRREQAREGDGLEDIAEVAGAPAG